MWFAGSENLNKQKGATGSFFMSIVRVRTVLSDVDQHIHPKLMFASPEKASAAIPVAISNIGTPRNAFGM